jgi:hypothetical protein
VDATEVGVPSDYFYLAATGPLLSELLGDGACRVVSQHVVVDRVPAYLDGGRHSPGDFVASGSGTCITHQGLRQRWSYFVAAPGFGPVRRVGITRSGLYLAAAVTKATPQAPERLEHLLSNVRFGGDGIGDLARAARWLS